MSIHILQRLSVWSVELQIGKMRSFVSTLSKGRELIVQFSRLRSGFSLPAIFKSSNSKISSRKIRGATGMDVEMMGIGLDPTILRAFARIVNFGWWVGFTPYRYSGASEGIVWSAGRKYRWQHPLSVTCVIVLNSFFLFQSLGGALSGGLGGPAKIKQIYITAANLLLNVNQWISIRHFGEHHKVINAFLETTRGIQSTD
jgi:hypothetical protein